MFKMSEETMQANIAEADWLICQPDMFKIAVAITLYERCYKQKPCLELAYRLRDAYSVQCDGYIVENEKKERRLARQKKGKKNA